MSNSIERLEIRIAQLEGTVAALMTHVPELTAAFEELENLVHERIRKERYMDDVVRNVISETASELPPKEIHDEEYAYCAYEGQRKCSSPPIGFDSWEEVDFDRGNYSEEYIFRKKISELTEKEKKLIEDYGSAERKAMGY